MKHRAHAGYREERSRRLDADRRDDERTGGAWRWRQRGNEGWQRSREGGGYGSVYDSWRSGAGFAPAGFGFGPAEHPSQGGFEDQDWQVTRPARGRGAWAGDWEEASYHGRGPKGYRRSDDRIREDVCERLTDSWDVDATDVSVQVQDGEVTLAGSIPSRQQKRRASECVEHVPGVRDVFNQLRVSAQDAGRERWPGGAR
jgi:osmotically-inducible protein OsmY